MSHQFTCENILEVWDFRLSLGSPILYCDKKHWKVKVWANTPNLNEDKTLLAEYETDIVSDNNPRNKEGINACYIWLKSIRDKFSRPNIELRKPVTNLINSTNKEASKINNLIMSAQKNNDTRLFNEKTGELSNFIISANSMIKSASVKMNKEIKKLESGEQ